MVNHVDNRTKLLITGTAGLAFCGVLLETSLNVTFPEMTEYFHAGLSTVQWLTTGYLLVVALTVLAAAWLEHSFSTRTLVLSSVGIFLVSDLMCILAPQFSVLLAGRLLQGVSTGIVLPLVFSLIMRKVPLHIQGRYVGSAGMAVALAPSLGPTFGGAVVQMSSWRTIFMIVLPVELIFGIIALAASEKEQAKVGPFAWSQFVLLGVFLTGLTLGLSSLDAPGPVTWIALVVGLVALVGGIYVLTHQRNSLIRVAVFRSRTFTLALVLYFLVQFVQIGLTFVLPNMAQSVLGASSTVAGLLLLPGSLLAALCQPISGGFLDGHGIRGLLGVGSLAFLLSATGFLLLSRNLSVPLMIVLYACYMIGQACVFNNLLTVGLQHIEPDLVPDGNALFNTFQQYSGAASTGILAAIISGLPKIGGIQQGAQAFQYGASWAFVFVFVIVLVILLVAWALERSLGKEETTAVHEV